MLHWSSLIIYFIVGVLAIWVAHTLLNKNGLYFFCIVASIVASYFAKVHLFYKVFSIQMVVLPIIFLALFLCYYKYGKKESVRLFYIVLISQIVMFVLKFFELSFLDIFGGNVDEYGFLGVNNGIIRYLSWDYISSFVSTVIAFTLTSIAGYFFVSYVDINKKVPQVIRTAIYIGAVSIVNSLLFIIVAYSGYFSFVDILLTFLLYIAFDIIMSLLLGCVEWLINISVKENEKTNESSKNNIEATKLNDSKFKTTSYGNTKTVQSSTSSQTKPTVSSLNKSSTSTSKDYLTTKTSISSTKSKGSSKDMKPEDKAKISNILNKKK